MDTDYWGKCLVECYLKNANCHVLWDTGAMVSIMSRVFLDNYSLDTELQSLESLLGYEAELKLTAANGTQIPYIGWAVVKFVLKGKREGMPPLEVPMLVTKENLDQPIIDFNVIEEVIKYCDPRNQRL